MTHPFRLAMLFFCLLVAPVVAEPRPEQLDAVLPRFRELIQKARQATGVPGVSVAVVQGGKVVMLEGFGEAVVGGGTPVTPDTVFQLASCSKPVTSTAVAILVGQGKLSFDSRVADLDPAFRLSEPWVTDHLTVKDLLSHRSGLPGVAGNELEELGFDRNEILRRLRFVELGNRFRSDYSYSNFGYTQGGVTGARAWGTSFEDMLDTVLFKPLSMARTSARYADFQASPGHALGHIMEGTTAIQRYQRDPDAQAPAGGVSSSARDLSRFLLFHLARGEIDGKRLVPADTLRTIYEPIMLTRVNPATFGKAGFYGMGWGSEIGERGRAEIKHSGAFSTGARSQFVLVPEEDLGIVVLANAFPSGLPEGLSSGLLKLYFEGRAELADVLAVEQVVREAMSQMVASAGPGPRPAKPSPPLPARAYVGDYHNDYFGPVRVQATASGLSLGIGPGFSIAAPLVAWDRDTFSYAAELDDGPLISSVGFTVGPNGRAESLTIEEMDSFGLGTFRRVKPEPR